MKKTFFILLLPLLLVGCDMFNYHPYDGRVSGERDINKKNIDLIEKKMQGRTSFKFAFLSDTQRWYDETESAVEDINKREDIDFVLHGGDLSDFGVTKEFIWQRDILNKLRVPYTVIIGNHDFLANGSDIYQTLFGDFNYSFMAGNVKFMCLNTNALELDYSHPVPDFTFIEENLGATNAQHQKTVFAMHARPYSEQFNNNVAKIFQKTISEYPNLLFCLSGHDHNFKVDDIFDDGILYYGVSSIGKRQYIIFTITEDNYDYELVDF